MAKWNEMEYEDAKKRRQRRKQEQQKKDSERQEQEDRERKKSLIIRLSVAGVFLAVIAVMGGIWFMKGAEEKKEIESTASIDLKRGDARFRDREGTIWREIPEGYRPKSGDSVSTGKDSRLRLSFSDRDEVTLRPESELEITDIRNETTGLSKAFRVVRNDAIFGSSGIGHVREVMTDFARIVPQKGTGIFKVRVNRDKGLIEVVVRNGEVMVSDNKGIQSKKVPRGYGITIDFKAEYLTIPDPISISMVAETWE